MKPTRRSIYLAPQTQSSLAIYSNRSATIGSCLTRYFEIMDLVCPELERNEWLALCDACNDITLQTDSVKRDPARILWVAIEDAGRLEGLDAKWKTDCHALSAKLKNLKYDQQCAVIEVVTRFWEQDANSQNDSDTRLAKAKAKIKSSIP